MAYPAPTAKDMARAELELRDRARRAELEAQASAPPPPVTDSFGAFLKEYNPGVVRGHPEWRWDYRHHVAMQTELDQVTAGQLKRLKFQLPIRHTKSEHNTVAYVGYRLKKTPRIRILIVTYDQDQANTFSLDAQRYAEYVGLRLSSERSGSSRWETVEGGLVVAAGINAGFASKGFDLILMDDVIGKRSDAESPAKLKQVKETIKGDILARAEPHTVVLFTMSRWNTKDPAAMIDEEIGGWRTLDLPGLAEDPETDTKAKPDPLGRAPGEPLWPEVLDAEWHEEKKREMGAYNYASLIMGRPRPHMGGMFKWDWWKMLYSRPKVGRLIRYWDMAGTRKKSEDHKPDWTAGVMMRELPAVKDANGVEQGHQTAVAHVRRRRCDVAARDSFMLDTAERDLKTYGDGVVYWIERQAGIGGEEATGNIARKLRKLGISVFHEAAGPLSKTERATPLSAACMGGDVYLEPDDEEEPWHDSFRNEYADFPFGDHDDQVDAGSGAYNKLNVKVDGKPTKGAYNISGATRL